MRLVRPSAQILRPRTRRPTSMLLLRWRSRSATCVAVQTCYPRALDMPPTALTERCLSLCVTPSSKKIQEIRIIVFDNSARCRPSYRTRSQAVDLIWVSDCWLSGAPACVPTVCPGCASCLEVAHRTPRKTDCRPGDKASFRQVQARHYGSDHNPAKCCHGDAVSGSHAIERRAATIAAHALSLGVRLTEHGLPRT